jgi:hypothetical protein
MKSKDSGTGSPGPGSPGPGLRGPLRPGRVRLLPAVALLVPLLVGSCAPLRERADSGDSTRTILPESPESAAAARSPGEADTAANLDITPKVPLDPGEKLIQVLNANLDIDKDDEQILVLRQRNEAEAPLRIAVIDYDPVKAAYARTWESPTRAVNLRLFEVSLKDLVGDHGLEIVCQGIDTKGNQTLDVFRKTPAPSGLGLYFTEILQIVSDGSIEIEETERSEAYRSGQKNGPSFVVYSFSRDAESENILDRVKHTYRWQYQQNRYVLANVEKLPGAVVAEAEMREFLDTYFTPSGVDAFEQLLSGPWMFAGPEGQQDIKYVMFSPKEKQIALYDGEVQEIYLWSNSFRSLPDRLTVFGTNESIESVLKTFFIQVLSPGTIYISIRGEESSDRSDGRYVKLSKELQESLLAERKGEVRPTAVKLQGLYQSGDGIKLIFEPPSFTWIEDKHEMAGGFVAFRLDRDVLYLQGLNRNGLPTDSATYIMEYSEKKEGEYVYHTLTLTPGRLSVQGIEPTSESKLVFEQMQRVEQTQPAQP